jgi:hypothetical protein
MALYRFQVSGRRPSGLPINDDVNVLFYEIGASDFNGRSAICDEILSKYESRLNVVLSNSEWECNAYAMADPLPRPVVGRATRNFGGVGEGGPPEVALCLSYYAVRNLKRLRGRIYVGPFLATTISERIPNASLLGRVLGFGQDLASIGESALVPDSEWVIYSPTDNVARNITNIWVDNEWDTQRRRGVKASTRQTATVD